MALYIQKRSIVLANGQQIPIARLKQLRARHLGHVPGTEQIENEGSRLLCKFTESRFDVFCHHVCFWGGRPQIANRVLMAPWSKRLETLRRLRRAIRETDIAVSIGVVTDLHGLGISFGSKHLRFLAPNLFGILDSRIRDAGGYRTSVADYVAYCSFCKQVSDAARVRLQVADVDMALYAYIKKW
jgi:hypothetical protein